MAKLNNETVARESIKVREKYDTMEISEANLTFAFELQGYVAAMADKDVPLDEILIKIVDFCFMVYKANK